MTCKETRTYMDGYFDGELDLVRSIELERHLHDCPACAQLHEGSTAMRAAMGASSLRYRAPEALRKTIHAALVERDRPERKWFHVQWPALAATAAAIALAAVWWIRPMPSVVEREVVASHIRSMMANHLTDVPSTDQHTVKPWFAGKLDFSPPVRDFPDEGFKLIGGRMDYIDNLPVAAIVYRRNQHVINVFVWPAAEGDRPMRASVRQGYNIVSLVRSGTAYWLVSDLNRSELEHFASAFTDVH